MRLWRWHEGVGGGGDGAWDWFGKYILLTMKTFSID
jgi:hypothetical protein